MRRPSYKEIENFLLQVKEAIDEDNWEFEQRDKNMKFLASIGYLIPDAIDEIYDLKCSDYEDGPKPDEGIRFSHEMVWMFKKEIEGHTTYIKIKISECRDNQLFCLSFHKDKHKF